MQECESPQLCARRPAVLEWPSPDVFRSPDRKSLVDGGCPTASLHLSQCKESLISQLIKQHSHWERAGMTRGCAGEPEGHGRVLYRHCFRMTALIAYVKTHVRIRSNKHQECIHMFGGSEHLLQQKSSTKFRFRSPELKDIGWRFRMRKHIRKLLSITPPLLLTILRNLG